MQVIATVLGGDGVRRPTTAFPRTMETALNVGANFSHRWLCYEAADEARRAGHQNWIKAPYNNVSSLTHPDVAQYLEDPRISGIVWLATWRALETSQGVYNFSGIIAGLNRCAVLGKRMIVRCLAKVYSGNITDPGGAIPLPANLALPDYIPANSATYGGTPFRGGIYPVYLGGGGVGWGAQFEYAEVLARWKALVAAANAAFGLHPAFAGWAGPDESARSSFNGSSLPPGQSFATVSAANRTIYTHDIATFGTAKCWPHINYVDSEKALALANDDSIGEQTWTAQQGVNIAYTDTYPVPKTSTIFMQPVYWTKPRDSMAAPRQIMTTVDLLSLGANDAGLNQRMLDCARQTYRLNSDITVWHYFVANATDRAAYWAAEKLAMDTAL